LGPVCFAFGQLAFLFVGPAKGKLFLSGFAFPFFLWLFKQVLAVCVCACVGVFVTHLTNLFVSIVVGVT